MATFLVMNVLCTFLSFFLHENMKTGQVPKNMKKHENMPSPRPVIFRYMFQHFNQYGTCRYHKDKTYFMIYRISYIDIQYIE